MRIAVFGGSFDPFHLGHEGIVEGLYKYVDKVLIVPAFKSPFKQDRAVTDAKLRMQMASSARAEVSDIEFRLGRTVYTYELLSELALIYKEDELCFVIGADSMLTLRHWARPQEIAKYHILVVPRPNFCNNLNEAVQQFCHEYHARITVCDFVGKDISSTQVRLLTAFNDVGSVVSKEVANIIAQHNLYTDFAPMVNSLASFGMTPKRIEHTKQTALRALALGSIHGGDAHKLATAAILHDVAKYMDLQTAMQSGYIDSAGYKELEKLPPACRHAPLGAIIASKKFCQTEPEILDAIAYHCTGRPNMSLTEKILFLADLTESSRSFLHEIPHICKHSNTQGQLDKAMELGLEYVLSDLKQRQQQIFPLTQQAYYYYKNLHEV